MLVRIKTWKQMEKEFGINEEGGIDCFPWFIKGMEFFLPTSRIIKIYESGGGNTNWRADSKHIYIVSKDMIDDNIIISYTIYGELI